MQVKWRVFVLVMAEKEYDLQQYHDIQASTLVALTRENPVLDPELYYTSTINYLNIWQTLLLTRGS